jgi:Sulfotransferase domain
VAPRGRPGILERRARGLNARVRRLERDVKRALRIGVQVSPYTNIYHCCTQKTASQSFREIYGDEAFFQYTGLHVKPHREMGLREADIRQPLPEKTIAYLYIGYPAFRAIPKPASYKALFLMRDPRDAVVSWYFGVQGGMKQTFVVPEMRERVTSLDRQAGLRYVTDKLESLGYFEAQRSWMDPEVAEQGIRVFRYEAFAADNRKFLQDLFQYLDIPMPADEVNALAGRHGFSRRAGGRTQGEEKPGSHNRKGVGGDWANQFDPETTQHFRLVTGDLLEVLGYQERPTA